MSYQEVSTFQKQHLEQDQAELLKGIKHEIAEVFGVHAGSIQIVVDGGAGTGKTTLSDQFLEYDFARFSAGSLYRYMTWMANRLYITNVQLDDKIAKSSIRESEVAVDGKKVPLESVLSKTEFQWHKVENRGAKQYIFSAPSPTQKNVRVRADDLNLGSLSVLDFVSEVSSWRDVRTRVDNEFVRLSKQVVGQDSQSRAIFEGRDGYGKGFENTWNVYLFTNEQTKKARLEHRYREKKTKDREELVDQELSRDAEDTSRISGKLLTLEEAKESGFYHLVIDTSELRPEQVRLLVAGYVAEQLSKVENITADADLKPSPFAELLRQWPNVKQAVFVRSQ